MIVIRRYPSKSTAELEKSILQGAGIKAEVFGLGVAWEGGFDGVELRVAKEQAEEALALLNSVQILPDSEA